jgi:hypothetical protein
MRTQCLGQVRVRTLLYGSRDGNLARAASCLDRQVAQLLIYNVVLYVTCTSEGAPVIIRGSSYHEFPCTE